MIDLLGVPYDGSSSFLAGAADAPGALRKALSSASSNMCTEAGLDLSTCGGWIDSGNVAWGADVKNAITEAIDRRLQTGHRVLSVGGDHSITYPILKAYGRRFRPLTLVHFDAHSDLYDEFEGDPYSHACPFARIMEDGLTDRLIQIGIRTQTPALRAQAERFGVEVIEMRSIREAAGLSIKTPVYVSLDLDVLDPAFAPGISHHEPGGLSTRALIDLIQGIEAPVIGADIVELNPRRDLNGVTAMVAAKLLKELLGLMLSAPGASLEAE